MTRKENKGGELSNKQVEEELARTSADRSGRGYVGTQDTGDQTIRSMGSETQRKDGNPPEHLEEGEKPDD